MSVTALVFLPVFVLIFVIAIPVLVGVLVYNDARRRGLPPLAWALVVSLVPSLLGLVAYLVVCAVGQFRRCSACGAPVRGEYTVCPQCGAQLHARCESCGASVQPGWKVCARCGAPLPATADATLPAGTNQKALWTVLAIVAVLVVLFLVFMFLLLIANFAV